MRAKEISKGEFRQLINHKIEGILESQGQIFEPLALPVERSLTIRGNRPLEANLTS